MFTAFISNIHLHVVAVQAARAAALPLVGQPRPQRASVAITPSNVLHLSGTVMVNGTLGPLTGTGFQ